MDNDLIKMRDLFRETVDIIDEMLNLQEREAVGEDVKKDIESAVGRFMYKMIKLSNFQ